MSAESDVTLALETEDAVAASVRAVVIAGLEEYNLQHAEAPDFRRLVASARDATGHVVGGLVGETAWRWLHVDLLWVAQDHRRRGLGGRLLDEAQREAARRGCGHVSLDTFDFQALPFYERLGFTIFGVQEDCPPGHRRFYLRKAIAAGGNG